eukprot:33605-Eustigmatos_ZCMA.PRE.1
MTHRNHSPQVILSALDRRADIAITPDRKWSAWVTMALLFLELLAQPTPPEKKPSDGEGKEGEGKKGTDKEEGKAEAMDVAATDSK